MCTGLEIAVLGLMAAGTATTLYAQDTAAKQQESDLKYQAAQAEADAKAEAGAAQVEADRLRKASKAQRAQAVAAAAASGIDVSSPTALKIDEEIVSNAEEDATLTVLQGSDRAKRLGQQAALDRAGASQIRSAGRINQAATLLGGASNAAVYGNDAWKRAKQGGGG